MRAAGAPIVVKADGLAAGKGVVVAADADEAARAVHHMMNERAFGDAGRVWVAGESPGGWHDSIGAGLWYTTPAATVALESALGERTSFYLRLGMSL